MRKFYLADREDLRFSRTARRAKIGFPPARFAARWRGTVSLPPARFAQRSKARAKGARASTVALARAFLAGRPLFGRPAGQKIIKNLFKSFLKVFKKF